MFNLKYLLRLAEEGLVAGLATFGTVLLADDAAFGTAALSAAAVAGLRVAYGVVVKGLGEADRPSVQ